MTQARKAFGSTPVARSVIGISGMLVAMGLGLMAAVSGCEQSSTPPAPAPQGGLSQDPTSLLGRSAKTGKNAAQQIENKQAETVGMANEVTGRGGNLNIAGLSWPVAGTWNKVQPASNFVAAEYRFSGEGGEARLTLSTFGGDGRTGPGGTIDMNVQRWEAQFRDPETGSSVVAHLTVRTVAGCKVTLVSLEGTMRGGTPGGPAADTPDMAVRGALIEGPQGLVVVKLTGPKETIDGASADWDTMIQGMTKASQ